MSGSSAETACSDSLGKIVVFRLDILEDGDQGVFLVFVLPDKGVHAVSLDIHVSYLLQYLGDDGEI